MTRALGLTDALGWFTELRETGPHVGQLTKGYDKGHIRTATWKRRARRDIRGGTLCFHALSSISPTPPRGHLPGLNPLLLGFCGALIMQTFPSLPLCPAPLPSPEDGGRG